MKFGSGMYCDLNTDSLCRTRGERSCWLCHIIKTLIHAVYPAHVLGHWLPMIHRR